MPTLPDALSPGSEAALSAWAARVRANRDQAERMREPAPPSDFYAPVASSFRADPRRTDEPVLNHLRTLVRPGETWLDIGAGGGRYSLALALEAKEVIAVEPSNGMRAVLRQAMAEEGIGNITIHETEWPTSALTVHADVAFPASLFWPGVHGESRELLPALPEFLALQLARGRLCEVALFERPAATYASREALVVGMRQQLFVAPGSEKDQRLHDMIDKIAVQDAAGRLSLGWHAAPLGVVSWRAG
jgi:SAM-dependent methyltransferase